MQQPLFLYWSSFLLTHLLLPTSSVSSIAFQPFRRFRSTSGTTATRGRSSLTMTQDTPINTIDNRPFERSKPLTQSSYTARVDSDSTIQSQDVATLPRPGTSSPTSLKFRTTPKGDVWLTYLLPDDPSSLTRRLCATHILPSSPNTPTHTHTHPRNLFTPPTNRKGGTEDDYSLEEKLRRERARMMATGVTEYEVSKGVGGGMLVPFGGAIWWLEVPIGGGGEMRKMVETNAGKTDPNDFHALPTSAPLLDAKPSSDGSIIAFIASDEIYVISTTNPSSHPPQPRRITSTARSVPGRTNGVADYLAMEELERSEGFWISPHGEFVAYEEVDESHVPTYRIVHQGEDRGLATSVSGTMEKKEVEEGAKVTVEGTRYPFAGARNPLVRFGVVETGLGSGIEKDSGKGGDKEKVVWFDLTQPFGDDFYLARVEWLDHIPDGQSDSTQLVVQILNRRQNKLALLLLDCATEKTTTLHIENAPNDKSWVNLNSSFRPLSNDGTDGGTFRFLWASERDGYSHLYVLESLLSDGGVANAGDAGARVVQRLTGPGEFICEEVAGIDRDKKLVYYMGTAPDQWLERHLFVVPYGGDGVVEGEGSTPVCLTGSVAGHHSCVLDVSAGLFTDTVSSTTRAPVVTVYELPSLDEGTENTPSHHPLKEVYKLHDAATDPRVSRYGTALQPPTFHTFPSTDGAVTLQSALYLPDEDKHGKGPYPLVVATYGGPHVQYVQNNWATMTVDLRSQFLRANGFAVLKVDNRGSSRRGLVFETPIYGRMGELEVADQVAGVQWAVERGTADPERVAVSGWSYGGYMSLKCLTDRPDVFHAAISGAPVTDWTLYDSAYTERYMGLPQENTEGYVKSSALAKVKDVEGSLLLCHGLLDENVLFRQSAVLVNALIEHRKAYDLALFPSERHGPRRPQDRAFLEERILAFLQRSLGV